MPKADNQDKFRLNFKQFLREKINDYRMLHLPIPQVGCKNVIFVFFENPFRKMLFSVPPGTTYW